MPGYVLAIGDTHIGHRLGLLNPDTLVLQQKPNGELTEEKVSLNLYQKYLWYDIFLPALKEVEKITIGSKLIVLHGGDLLHGNKYNEESNTASEMNQVTMAVDAMKPLLNLPSCTAIRLAAGTGAHDFTEHSGTLLACKFLKTLYPSRDVAANYQGLVDVMGTSIDYAHHGPGEGIRIYLNGNNVRYYLSDLMIRCLANDITPPDLVLRWHVHGKQDETFTMGNYKSRILIIPSMCGMSFHARKVTRSKFLVTNGFALFETKENEGITRVWKFYREDDLRTKEKLL